MIKKIVFSILFFSLVACSAIQSQIEPLKVSVNGVSIERFDLTHAHMTIDLNVRNPNGIGLDLESVDYVFSINDIQLIDETLSTPISIAANGQSSVKLPVQLSLFGAMKILRTLSSQTSHTYTVDGKVRAKRIPFPISFGHKDSIDLASARKSKSF